MNSKNETRLLKMDTDFNIYVNKSLNKVKEKIVLLNKESNAIKDKIIKDIDELITSSNNLSEKIEEFLIKKNWKKDEKMNEIQSIKEIYNTLFENMIPICENTHINNLQKLKKDLNNIMIALSDPEFNPPNVNSFTLSLNKENISEDSNSIISISKLEKSETIQGEIFEGYNNFLDDCMNTNNSRYTKISINNNVKINKNSKIDSLLISETNKNIINTNNNILKDELKNKLDSLDFNFYSDDEITAEEEKNIKNNGNEFLNNSNNFYYIISLITKRKNISINKDKIKHFLLNNIKEQLNIIENNIFVSFDNTKNFIEAYIKTKDFCCSSINVIKKDYPDFNKLFEYKMLYEQILKIGKEYFDYNGNTISPNSSFNNFRGKEEYDPPYGWFGIGLKIDTYEDNKDWIENKSNTSKWAIAYHGVGQLLSNEKVQNKIINIITQKNLKPTNVQKYKDYKDKRNPGNNIGEGIYLTPKIKMAEYFAGIININNKKYKILLMARVLIEKIREPEDVEYWILNNDDIRVYRILVKEINAN